MTKICARLSSSNTCNALRTLIKADSCQTRSRLFFHSLGFALAFSAACGCGTFEKKKGDTPVTASSSAPIPLPLDGTWTINCDSTGHKIIAVVAGLKMTKFLYVYNTDVSPPCSGLPAYSATVNMTFTYGKPVSHIEGAQNIDMTVVSVEQIPTEQAEVDYLNTKGNSDSTDWKLNTAKDITGKDDMPAKGTVIYSIFKVDGNKLYGGDTDTGDGTSDAKRPIALDLKDFYTKQ